MKRLNKRKGFTLIEMVIVIAIIVILAIVVYYSVAAYMTRAKSATEKMEEHISVVEAVTSEIENQVGA